ncbi:MAG: helix-turn-helix transcriptional regulator [Lachnospiraceae bacterium]|nr:helix-turn-helix transcriptional regulator [Lachnospiraceae bacterium]
MADKIMKNNAKNIDKSNTANNMEEVHIFDLQKQLMKRAASNPEFLKLWNDSENEYELIFQVIRLRKMQNLSQKQLAELIGTRQELISRMESQKNSPTLSNFCKIVNKLGYELRIEKKSDF